MCPGRSHEYRRDLSNRNRADRRGSTRRKMTDTLRRKRSKQGRLAKGLESLGTVRGPGAGPESRRPPSFKVELNSNRFPIASDKANTYPRTRGREGRVPLRRCSFEKEPELGPVARGKS